MVIFGYKQTVKELATLMAVCRLCGMQGWQRLYRVITWFSLFFLPVLPLWVSRKAICGTCGNKYKVTKPEADAFMAQAGVH